MLEPSKEVQLKKELDRLDSKRRSKVLDSIGRRIQETANSLQSAKPEPCIVCKVTAPPAFSITPPPTVGGTSMHFCSRTCYQNWEMLRNCVVCGKSCVPVFSINPPSGFGRATHFCSKACYAEWDMKVTVSSRSASTTVDATVQAQSDENGTADDNRTMVSVPPLDVTSLPRPPSTGRSSILTYSTYSSCDCSACDGCSYDTASTYSSWQTGDTCSTCTGSTFTTARSRHTWKTASSKPSRASQRSRNTQNTQKSVISNASGRQRSAGMAAASSDLFEAKPLRPASSNILRPPLPSRPPTGAKNVQTSLPAPTEPRGVTARVATPHPVVLGIPDNAVTTVSTPKQPSVRSKQLARPEVLRQQALARQRQSLWEKVNPMHDVERHLSTVHLTDFKQTPTDPVDKEHFHTADGVSDYQDAFLKAQKMLKGSSTQNERK